MVHLLKILIGQKLSKKFINLKRENIYLSQTPQAFDYKELYKLQSDKSSDVTDDANLFIKAGKRIKIIKGELDNKKITISSDIKINKSAKYGLGFDIHRLVPNKILYLGGIKIPFSLNDKLTALNISEKFFIWLKVLAE